MQQSASSTPWKTEYSSQFMFIVPDGDDEKVEDPNRFNVSGFTDENGLKPDHTFGKSENSGYGGLGSNVMFNQEFPTKTPLPKPNYTPSFTSDTTPNRHVTHNPENNLASGIKPKNFSSTPSVSRTSTPPMPSTQDLVHKHYEIAPPPKSIQKISFSSSLLDHSGGKRVPVPETKHDHHHEHNEHEHHHHHHHHHQHHEKEHSPSRPLTPHTPPQRERERDKAKEKDQSKNVGMKPKPTPIQKQVQIQNTARPMDLTELSMDSPKNEKTETPRENPVIVQPHDNDNGNLASHRCTHQWHSVNSKKPYSPSLECSMCHSSPLPNTQKYKNFDPSSSVETNPKFYRYLPASFTKSIPAAGVRMARGQNISLNQPI